MSDAVKRYDRYKVVHYIFGRAMTNVFENITEANHFIDLLMTLDGIEAVELVGVVEEHQPLKRWERTHEQTID